METEMGFFSRNKGLSGEEEILLATLFWRSRMKRRRRRYSPGYLMKELDGLTLSESQAFHAMIALSHKGLVQTHLVKVRTNERESVCKLTEAGTRYVKENLLVSDAVADLQNIVLDEVDDGSEFSDGEPEDALDFLRWSVKAGKQLERLQYLNDPAIKVRISAQTAEAIAEVLEKAIDKVRSSNTISSDSRSLIVSTLEAGYKLVKSKWFYGSIILWLILKPLYEAYSSAIEDNAKPIIQEAFDGVITLISL